MRGPDYAAQLYLLATRFFPTTASKALPSFDDLTRVASPGKLSIHTPFYCSDIHGSVPPTYLGGNPFILSASNGPIWPLWVPDQYAVSKPLESRQPLSYRAAGIYLGWAAHLFQDMAHPYHAKNISGGGHERTENFLGSILQYFGHLPVLQGSYHYSSFQLADTRFLDARQYVSRQAMCQALQADSSVRQRADRVHYQAEWLFDDIRDVDSTSSPNFPGALGAYEYLMDMAIKETIRLAACVDQDLETNPRPVTPDDSSGPDDSDPPETCNCPAGRRCCEPGVCVSARQSCP